MRGHGRGRRGFFWEAGGHLGTGRLNWKRVNCRLRIQDLVMWDIPAAKVFLPPLFPLLSLMACWKYWLRRRFNRCLRALGAPRRPAPYNGIFSTVSHTFTILISNFPQRWNKYFAETSDVINPIWKKIENLISIKFIVFRPLPSMISDQEIFFSSNVAFLSFVRNSRVVTRASKRIVTATWPSLSQ